MTNAQMEAAIIRDIRKAGGEIRLKFQLAPFWYTSTVDWMSKGRRGVRIVDRLNKGRFDEIWVVAEG